MTGMINMSTATTVVICAWCKAIKSYPGPADVTYETCERCKEEQRRQIEKNAYHLSTNRTPFFDQILSMTQ